MELDERLESENYGNKVSKKSLVNALYETASLCYDEYIEKMLDLQILIEEREEIIMRQNNLIEGKVYHHVMIDSEKQV